MNLAQSLMTCIALATMPVACSGGGGGGAGGGNGGQLTTSANWAGTWEVTMTIESSTCPPARIAQFEAELKRSSSMSIIITMSGETASFDRGGDPVNNFELTSTNGRLQGTDAYGGNVKYDLGLTSADSFTGLAVHPIPTSPACELVLRWTATKTSGPITPGEDFAGTWMFTTTHRASACFPVSKPQTEEVTISIAGQTATLTAVGQPSFSLPLVNGRIQGTYLDVFHDFGLTGENSIAGTTTVEIPLQNGPCTVVSDLSAIRVGS